MRHDPQPAGDVEVFQWDTIGMSLAQNWHAQARTGFQFKSVEGF